MYFIEKPQSGAKSSLKRRSNFLRFSGDNQQGTFGRIKVIKKNDDWSFDVFGLQVQSQAGGNLTSPAYSGSNILHSMLSSGPEKER